ncbi:MAG: N-acetylmuramoyl-L-alanine amidase family protein [Thermotaleaceae bacterium]
MKRFIAFLLVLVFVLSSYGAAFAGRAEPISIRVSDDVTKKTYNVTVVNLRMGGEDVITDVPPMLLNNRTLVPIAFVVENLGAEIQWNQSERKATITTTDKTIVLQIDSAAAVVNGSPVSLPDRVPAKLMNYNGKSRTMVPLRFISEQLGMDVNWISETLTATVDSPKRSITGIEYNPNSRVPEVKIKTTGEVSFVPIYLQGSKVGGQDRLVLDIPNANLDIQNPALIDGNGLMRMDIQDKGISTIRASLFEPAPREVTRVVFDLEAPKGYNIEFDKTKNEVKVQFLNAVKGLKLDNKNDSSVILVETEETPVYNKIDLGNRLVVDILNAHLKTDIREINVSRDGVQRVRMGPFAPDSNYNPDDKIVRVVIDLEQGKSTENIFVEEEGSNLLIYFQDKPLQGFDYRKEAFDRSVLNLTLSERGSFEAEYDAKSGDYIIKVPQDLIGLKNTRLHVNDKILEYIDIDGITEAGYYVIRLKLALGTDYRLLTTTGTGNRVSVLFENSSIEEPVQEIPDYGKKLIVIDPGHGGKDPGAVSPKLALREKDLALDVSLRLNKLLEDAGFAVIMTRTDDTYIGLYERAEVANGLNADLFVSIHFNAHNNNSISGVQTLYNAADTTRDNKTFATIIQEEMLKELKAVDRKIVDRPNLVVIRETKMPAVLAEMAFLTNAQEEALAGTEAYRQKCAQALFNGITRYFEQKTSK